MSDPFVGEIRLFGFNFNPRGWGSCAGALLPISSNSTLFSLLGTHYGGDGRTTFGLPDLRGRAAMSYGRHPGSLYDWRIGKQAGAETHSLTQTEMPAHTHTAEFTPSTPASVTVAASTDIATLDTPTEGCYLAKNDGGRNPGVPIYRDSAGSNTVNLGGVSSEIGSGTVTVANSGASYAFNIVQPVLTLNYCIAMVGIYPPRS